MAMQQMDLLGVLKREYGSEYDRLPQTAEEADGGFYLQNGMFGSVDAEVLYAMVRHVKPSLVLEIGSGWSTLVIRQALDRNAEDDPPGVILDATDFSQLDVDAVISQVKPADMIVADTSHVFVEGHEIDLVLRAMEYLEDVWVHFHDIFLPDGYPDAWAGRGYDEQQYLDAFLRSHPEWEPRLRLNELHVTEPRSLEATFASYDPNRAIGPGSYWLYRPTEFDATYGEDGPQWELDRDADPEHPHMFYSNRNGKQCLVCRKAPSNKLHERP